MIWSSRRRNRSIAFVGIFFFGRIAFPWASSSSARANHEPLENGIPKIKMQGSWPSPHRNLRFQNPTQPQKRFFFNDLGVVHGRLTSALMPQADTKLERLLARNAP